MAGLSLIATVSFAVETRVVEPLTAEAYEKDRAAKGVVLFAVRWDRRWKCGDFENAQLRLIGFDRLPSQKTEEEKPDLVVDDAPLIMTKPVFDSYAFLVEPGEYALSGLQIKVARSVSDVGQFKAPRSAFLKDGKSKGGTFSVGAGEIIYIGHFYLDCYQQPILWRYYAEGRDGFDEYLGVVKKNQPFLDITNAQYRLFKTTVFGRDYQLP
jgi:hypothetical protein